MKYRPRILLAAAVLALSACATVPEPLDKVQKRLVSGIQTMQKTSTASMRAGAITLEQNEDAQNKLAAARTAVMASKTATEATDAAAKVGVK